jgi:phosphoesterase RecJ-like protein
MKHGPPRPAPAIGAVCRVRNEQPVLPDPEFLALLSSAARVLVIGHFNPDGDALGASAALGEALRDMGRAVTVGVSGIVAPNLEFLLQACPCLRREFRRPSEARGTDWDLAVIVDCHGPDRVWPDHGREDFAGLPPYLVIDHHMHSDDVRGHLAIFHDPEASSTGEMVARVLKGLNSAFTPPVLEALLAAIASDTGFFTQANTSACSLREAADLVSRGGDLEGVNLKLNQSFSPARMRLLHLSLGTMEFFRGGKVAAMHLTGEMLELSGASREDSDGFVDFPRSVKGVELAVFFKEDGRGRVKVSLRSRYPVSARAIAVGCGGGGHELAAAYTDPVSTCREATDRFLSRLAGLLPEEEE